MRGGSKNTNYIASFDYTSNEGLVKRSKVETIFPRLNVTHRMFDNRLKIDAGLSGYQQSYGIPYNTNVYQSALIYNPTEPIKDENGKWTEVARDLYYNPLALLNETQGKNDATNLRMHATVTVTPIEGLDINGCFPEKSITNSPAIMKQRITALPLFRIKMVTRPVKHIRIRRI